MASRMLIEALNPVNDTNFPLQFQKGDLELRSVEEISAQLRVSCAFIRLCIDSGCKTHEGKLSSAALLQWLFEHYNLARQLSGFLPLATVEGTPAEIGRKLRMGNALLTLLEFGESRATRLQDKHGLGKLRCAVEQALNRA
jgi:hypothetical protein